MILTLTKPFNPGDADPGRNYTHLHLELMTYNSSAYAVQLSYAYGSLDKDDLFVPGAVPGLQSVSATGDELDALSSAAAQPKEPALAACLRLGYEMLQKKLGISGKLDYELPADPAAAAAPPANSAPVDDSAAAAGVAEK